MKANVFKNMIIALCAICFVSCYPGYEVPPSRIVISGIVRNETGEPLNSIQITIDTATFKIVDKGIVWRQEGYGYTQQNGEYVLSYSYRDGELPAEEWPHEINIIATDTCGIYETQSQTCPVSVRARNYKDKSIERLDGYVTADFVMHKK